MGILGKDIVRVECWKDFEKRETMKDETLKREIG